MYLRLQGSGEDLCFDEMRCCKVEGPDRGCGDPEGEFAVGGSVERGGARLSGLPRGEEWAACTKGCGRLLRRVSEVLQAVSAAWVWWGDEAESAEKGCMDPYTHRHTRRALYHPGQQGSKQGLSALRKPEPLLSCRRDQQAACLPARP